jgi:hypothetical protein
VGAWTRREDERRKRVWDRRQSAGGEHGAGVEAVRGEVFGHDVDVALLRQLQHSEHNREVGALLRQLLLDLEGGGERDTTTT